MTEEERELIVSRNNWNFIKSSMERRVKEYSDNSRYYNGLYIPFFLLGVVAHIVFGANNDIGSTLINIISSGIICGSSIGIVLYNIAYTLPLLSCKKKLKMINIIVEVLDKEIEKENSKSLDKNMENKEEKEKGEIKYSYNNRALDYDNQQDKEIEFEEEKEQNEIKKYQKIRKINNNKN